MCDCYSGEWDIGFNVPGHEVPVDYTGQDSLAFVLTQKKKRVYGNSCSNFHMVQISCKCLYAYHIQIVKLNLRFTLLTLLTTVYSWWIDLTAQMSQALPGVSYSVLFDFCIIIHDPAVLPSHDKN